MIYVLVYLILGVIVGIINIRINAEDTLDYIQNGKHPSEDFEDVAAYSVIILFNILLWPIVLIFFAFIPGLLKMLKIIESVMPDVEIKTKKKNEN